MPELLEAMSRADVGRVTMKRDAFRDLDLARAIRRLHADPERRERLVERAAAAEPYRWPRQREAYLTYIDRALAPPGSGNGNGTTAAVG